MSAIGDGEPGPAAHPISMHPVAPGGAKVAICSPARTAPPAPRSPNAVRTGRARPRGRPLPPQGRLRRRALPGGVQAPTDRLRRQRRRRPARPPSSRYRSITVEVGGQSPSCRRRSACPPRLRACVRDQSVEEGIAPYRSFQARIASRTHGRVRLRPIAPGWRACSSHTRHPCHRERQSERRILDTLPGSDASRRGPSRRLGRIGRP